MAQRNRIHCGCIVFFISTPAQAEKSKGRGICREQPAVDGSIDPKRGELPNQLVYAGMRETKNLMFYQALI